MQRYKIRAFWGKWCHLLIIVGFMLACIGIIFGSHILHKKFHTYADARAAGFLCMLPGVLLFALGFYLK